MHNLDIIEERLRDNIREAGYKFIEKKDSLFMKILGKVLFFNKKFNTNYTTVIGKTFYIPSKFDDFGQINKIICFAHELQHVRDKQKYPGIFQFTYLIPQIFALFSVFAVFNLWWLLCLLFLLPLPSPRAAWEWRGYKINIILFKMLQEDYDLSVSLDYETEYLREILNYFVSSNYYFMFPFKKYLSKEIVDIYSKYNNSFDNLTPCQLFLIQFIQSQKIINS